MSKATLTFTTRETAESFATQWTRHTLTGHTIGSGMTGVKVVLHNVSDDDKEWINSTISRLNND